MKGTIFMHWVNGEAMVISMMNQYSLKNYTLYERIEQGREFGVLLVYFQVLSL